MHSSPREARRRPSHDSVVRQVPHEAERSELERCIESATAALLARQRVDGHWVFELEADTTIPAEYIALQHFFGTSEPALEAKIANYLRRRQGPHGGWSLFYG